jgi:hypothetical protein
MGSPTVIPPPPAGFIPIEQAQGSGSIPPPPPGFVPIEQMGAVHRFTKSFNEGTIGTDNPSDITAGLKMAVSHPSTLVDSVKEMGKGAINAQASEGQKGIDAWKQPGFLSKIDAVGHFINSGIPLIGPMIGRAGEQLASGDVAGGLGTATAITAPLVAAHPVTAAAVADVGGRITAKLPSPRGAMSARMAEVPAGEQFSRGEVLQAARDKGVNLDLAQATDSSLADAAKKANRYSLASQSTYDASHTKNLAALEDWANKEASTYAPESADRATVGGQIQQTLKSGLDEAKNTARAQFEHLDETAPKSVDATATVEAEARKIIGENKSYYDAHPELKPKQAWGILEDLAKRPQVEEKIPGTASTKLVDAPAKEMSWSELHQLRSDLMDFYRNNPDIVKGRGDAWIQRMVSKIDETMTGASSGLSPEDLTTFREANHTWETVKSTYDNPQHPFYHAVRSQFPSQVPGMLSKGTPELASQVRATLGSLDGTFQRQFVETLLKDKNGTLDLGKLNQKLKGMPNDHLEAMLGKDGAKQLKLLGKVSQKVFADSNPSGTAKVGVPAAEISGMFNAPIATGAELAAQYGGAKLINSPKVVDFLTKPKKITAPLPRGSRP